MLARCHRFGNLTPQSASDRYGLHQFQRTPYSRSIYSKSKSKLPCPETGTNRCQNFPSSTRQQPQTPIFGQSERIHNKISGSVGPMRRMRRKFLSEAFPLGSASYPSSHSGQDSAASKATTDLRSVGTTLNGSESALVDFQTSNPAVRATLEHLDRHMPTPKEKLAELEFATSSAKSSFSKPTDTMLKEGNEQEKSSFKGRPLERIEVTDVVMDTKTCTSAIDTNGNNDYQLKSSNQAFSFDYQTLQ